MGENGETESSILRNKIGFLAYKNDNRLNHHFELISRVRKGNKKFWKLNKFGEYIYRYLFNIRKNFSGLMRLVQCPLCRKSLRVKLKGSWREKDFEDDLFWDAVSSVSKEDSSIYPEVFDVVLPSNNSNDHLFVANGLIVHNSMGVNLPSHTVIIPSAFRYGSFGMEKVPVREYKQCVGRAGRPRYDSEGRSVLIAKSEAEKQEFFDEYVFGEIEEITSKLGAEPVLRMHLLGLIAGNYVFDLASMEEFFSRTFFARQCGNMSGLFEKLQKILLELQEMGFVESTGKSFKATPIGKRVSDLYLDPLSAHAMICSLKAKSPFSETSYLFMLCNTIEFFPNFSAGKQNEAELWEKLQKNAAELPINAEREMFFDSSLIQKFNSALVLKEWVNETSEENILKQFRIQPGILFSKLQICDWLCYSLFEIGKALSLERHVPETAKLRKRRKHGVKEELIMLTELKGIGRVRARKLFKANIRTISDVKKTDIVDLKRIIGEKIAASVKQALGQSG